MRILMIGDVIGKPGRRALAALLPTLRRDLKIDLAIANGENAAGGFGLTVETAQEMLESGVDVITSGNHIWDQNEIIPYMEEESLVIRPLNYPPGTPGRGYINLGNALVVNLIGRVFVGNFDCPFRAMDRLLKELPKLPPVVIVDFHAEATSEKGALGWYVDGRVSAVVGTHTHVATADARILPNGTAFVSDLGMVGPINSIIGSEPEEVLDRFLTQTPRKLRVAKEGPLVFNSVMIEVDEGTGMASEIVRVDRHLE